MILSPLEVYIEVHGENNGVFFVNKSEGKQLQRPSLLYPPLFITLLSLVLVEDVETFRPCERMDLFFLLKIFHPYRYVKIARIQVFVLLLGHVSREGYYDIVHVDLSTSSFPIFQYNLTLAISCGFGFLPSNPNHCPVCPMYLTCTTGKDYYGLILSRIHAGLVQRDSEDCSYVYVS